MHNDVGQQCIRKTTHPCFARLFAAYRFSKPDRHQEVDSDYSVLCLGFLGCWAWELTYFFFKDEKGLGLGSWKTPKRNPNEFCLKIVVQCCMTENATRSQSCFLPWESGAILSQAWTQQCGVVSYFMQQALPNSLADISEEKDLLQRCYGQKATGWKG